MRGTSISIEVRCFGCDKPSAEISIEHEEERACIFVARHLRGRRDNILLTISTLENHLSGAGRSPDHNGRNPYNVRILAGYKR